MRIITGSARGINLETLEGEATRPTADRVKEAMFSMLQFDMEGRRVLDLFAGSGQLGLEALSRGAASAVFVDNSRDAVNIVLKNAAKTKLKDRCRAAVYDYETYLKGAAGKEDFHIIFLDPPYNTDAMVNALRLISEGSLLAEGGIIACETDTAPEERQKRKKAPREDDETAVLRDVFCGDEALMSEFVIRKTTRYGRTRLTLLEGV